MTSQTDRQFARYRETGKPDSLAYVFDETAPGLLLLALHLTKDDLLAEDLVQATFLKIIENAAGYDPSQPFLPWASAILTNEARRQWRRNASRPTVAVDDVDAYADTGPIDPQRAASEAETLHAVVSAIDGLEATYRPVVRLKVVHGMKPGAIAKVLDIEPAVARTRLSRGLSQLRSRLPATVAGALAITLGGRGMAQVREVVMDRCRGLTSGGDPSNAEVGGDEPAALRGARATVMKRSLAWLIGSLSVVLAGLLGTTIWWASGASLGPPPQTFATASSASDAIEVGAAHPQLVRQPGAAPDAPAPATSTTGTWSLTGIVMGKAGPVAGARIAAALLVGCDERAQPVVTTDPAGRYEVPLDGLKRLGTLGLLDASVQLRITAPGYQPLSDIVLDVGPPTWREEWGIERDVELTRGEILRGRILGPDHEPATGWTRGRVVSVDSPFSTDWFETDTRAREPGEALDPSVLQLPVVGAPPYRLEVSSAQGSAFVPLPYMPANGDIGDVVLDPLARVHGKVVTTAGVPVPFANVRVWRMDQASGAEAGPDARDRPEWCDGAVVAAEARNVRTDVDGRFLANGLRAGTYRVSLEYGDVDRVAHLCQTDGPPVELAVDGQVLSVWTVDHDDAAVPGMTLLCDANAPGAQWSGRNAINDVPGRFDFLVPFGSTWTFRSGHWQARVERFAHRAASDAPRAELRLQVEPLPGSGRIALSVVGEDGVAVNEYGVDLHHRDSDHYLDTIPARALANTMLPAGRYTLTVAPLHPVTDPAAAFAAVEHEIAVSEDTTTQLAVTVARRGVLEVLAARADVSAEEPIPVERFHAERWQRCGVLHPLDGAAASRSPDVLLRATAVFEGGPHTVRFVGARGTSEEHSVDIVPGRTVRLRAAFSPR